MEGLEERGEMGQHMWEGENRKRREREWESGGWEYWEIKMEGGEMGGDQQGERDVAVDTVEGKGAMGEGMGGNRTESSDEGGKMREMEGVRDVEGKGIDGGGCDGSKKGENLARMEPNSRREPLRGGRRKKGSISEGEKQMMAHYMKRWLGVAPCKTKQN